MSYKVLLKLLTKTFLLDDDLPEFKANNSLKTAIDSHRASFTSLQKSLGEAKLEVIWNDEMRGCTKEYDAVVKSMQRLAQSVGGLRSSCGLQFELMQQDGGRNSKKPTSFSSSSSRNTDKKLNGGSKNKETWNIKADHHRRKLEGEIKRQKHHQQQQQHVSPKAEADGEDEFFKLPNHHSHKGHNDDDDDDEDGTLIEFIHTIRQPLKSLAYTCKQTILHLQIGFSSKPRTGPNDETLKNNLIKAIALFEVSQRQAVKRLNRHRLKHHQPNTNNPSGSSSLMDNYAPSEDVFLVYFFVFNMIEFARELISLVESVQALSIAKQKKRTLCALIYQFFTTPKPVLKENKKPAFVPNERHKMDTLHTPVPKTQWRRMILKVWRTFSLFKLQKMRYATKATIAVIILALPAFWEHTGAWYREWRMEWALITVSIICLFSYLC